MISLAVVVAGLAIIAFATKPAAIKPYLDVPELPADLDQFVADSEAAAHKRFGIVEGAEMRIVWQPSFEGRQTRLSLVYFHGFSATRQEIAPVPQMIADRLGANLLEVRTSGHGRVRERLEDVTAEDWLSDAAEALAIGTRIGERVVLFGTSTGASLALAMYPNALMENVDAIVMMSPNIYLMDENSESLTIPGAPILAWLALGDSRTWAASNELQEKYWTTTYPTDTTIEMMRLVQFARSVIPREVKQRLLTIASPDDEVVNTAKSQDFLQKTRAPSNEFVAFTDGGDRSRHVLAGDILAPENNQAMVDIVVDFLSKSAD